VSQRTGGTETSETPAWERLAREAMEPPQLEPVHGNLQQLLTFEVEGAPYAVPVERVREIVRIRPITPVPQVPDAVRGVISLRGDIVQVIDARLRLGSTPQEPTPTSRIVIVDDAEGSLSGLLVDAVSGVLRVDEGELRPTSSEAGAVSSLCPHDGRFVSMLDLERVLNVDAGL
jgi:purine-binding chemotaxis protein CheW